MTYRELRIVRQDRADAGENRARAGTKTMPVATRRFAGYPLTSTIVERGFAVEARSNFSLIQGRLRAMREIKPILRPLLPLP